MPITALDWHVTADDLAKSLRTDVIEGLAAPPRSMPPKWFYDARGSELFDEITRLEEYYPTRAERAILRDHAADVAAACGADTLVELGAGSGEKTRLLLDALSRHGTLRRYVPVDVSGDYLVGAARQVADAYPDLEVHAVAADFERHLDLLPSGGRRLTVFLGGTIGNFEPAQRASFLAELGLAAGTRDMLLVGIDLVKEPDRMVRAYDDERGVTAEFNRGVLRVINRELDADFAPETFEHLAVWDADNEWVEMRLRSDRAQHVRFGALGFEIDLAAGEQIRTEVSAKFRLAAFDAELVPAGLVLDRWWTDPAGDFALCLIRPAR